MRRRWRRANFRNLAPAPFHILAQKLRGLSQRLFPRRRKKIAGERKVFWGNFRVRKLSRLGEAENLGRELEKRKPDEKD